VESQAAERNRSKGGWEEHHRFLLATQLRRLEAAEQDIAALDRIEAKLARYRVQHALLVEWAVAAALIAEIGVDISVFLRSTISLHGLAVFPATMRAPAPCSSVPPLPPRGPLHIGPATRHVTDMPGIADDEVEMPFQHGIDRAPANAGALRADLRHPKLLQPVPQCFQIARHRPKGPHLLPPQTLARGANQDAGNDHLLMHVKPGARSMITCIFASIPRVLPEPDGDKKWYLYVARAGLLIRVASHRRGVCLNTIARGEIRTNRLAPPPFSPITARQRRWLAAQATAAWAFV
jgi:hypothetical protein